MMGSETISRPVSLSSLPRRQVNITFAGVLLAMFLSSLDQTIVGTAMPRIISDLGGFSHYTWVTSAYIITSAVIIPITGKLTDMYGRKVFYISGLVIFTLASLLCGLSTTITQIIVFRGLQGIGAGIMMVVPVFTIITRVPAAGLLMFLGGFATLCIPVLVHLLTLPSELDASFNRAMPLLSSGDYIPTEDIPAARKILLACALTYVANALMGLLNVWRWIRVLRR